MRYTLITQVALISIALIIVFAFVKPLLGEIKTSQDEIFLYADAVDKATQFNQKLQSLIAKRDAFSATDKVSLSTFIPTKIDSIKVMRDIQGIFATANKPIISLTATDVVLPQTDPGFNSQVAAPTPSNSTHQDFNITFVGNYSDVKNILQMVNKNETLLEVMELSFEKVDSAVPNTSEKKNAPENLPKGLFRFHLIIRTFAVYDVLQTGI